MNNRFIILWIMSLFFVVQSCSTEKKNVELEKTVEEQQITANKIEDQDSRMYYVGDLYCVINDTVLIFNIGDGWASWHSIYNTFEPTYYFNFFLIDKRYNNFSEFSKEYLMFKKHFEGPNQTATLEHSGISIRGERFLLYDEENKPNEMSLFSYNTIINDLPYDEGRGEYYRSRHKDIIKEWEKNPIKNMDTTICYLDMNKNVCRLTSGYKGRFEKGPEIQYQYPIDKQFSVIITEPDTVVRLGFTKIIDKPTRSIILLNAKKYKHFDYVCVRYNGLIELAKDLHKSIKPTEYPFLSTLE